MLDIKKLFTKILNLGVFEDSNGDVSITRKTTADEFYSEKTDGYGFQQVCDGNSGTAGIEITRTDENTAMAVGINANGITHGIYSNKNSRWMIYDDATGITKLAASTAEVHGYTIATRETLVSQAYDTGKTTISGSGTSSQLTSTKTKTGYYPLGIVGYQLFGSQAVHLRLLELQMSARDSGTVTVRYKIRNEASANSTDTYIHYSVLWIKE